MAERSVVEGFEAVVLRSLGGELDVTFVPEAGMVAASLRHRGEELLGQRRGVAAWAERGKTMGIPLLHPWANRLSAERYEAAGRAARVPDLPFVAREESGLPIHGLVEPAGAWRARGAISDSGDGLVGELDFPPDGERAAAFPFPHRMTVEASLAGATLSIRTTVEATGDVAVPVSFGYHPYLRLPDVPRADWQVSLPAMRRMDLDARGIPAGASHPAGAWTGTLGDRTFDDAFAGVPSGGVFSLAGGGRRITVRFDDGFPFAQVFAPPTDDVVCFEPMTAPVDALVSGDDLTVVGPAGRYTAAFSITVERFAATRPET